MNGEDFNIVSQTALTVLLLLGLGLAFAWGAVTVWRRMGDRPRELVAITVLAICCTIIAQKVSIVFDRFVADAGTYATNDVFHVSISNATNYASFDLSTSDVLVYAREHGRTNATDWIELLPRKTFADLPADYAIMNATNFDYMIYVDYVPPSPVHTNGVFELQGFIIDDTDAGRAAGFINSMPKLEITP